MKQKIYSIFDKVAEVFNQPFFMQNENMARRAYLNLAQDDTTTIGMNHNDFVLFEIGEFNDQTGIIESVPPVVVDTQEV